MKLEDGAYRLNSIFKGCDLIGYYFNDKIIVIKNSPLWCYVKNNSILVSAQGNILFYSTKQVASLMNTSKYSIKINKVYQPTLPSFTIFECDNNAKFYKNKETKAQFNYVK